MLSFLKTPRGPCRHTEIGTCTGRTLHQEKPANCPGRDEMQQAGGHAKFSRVGFFQSYSLPALEGELGPLAGWMGGPIEGRGETPKESRGRCVAGQGRAGSALACMK